MNKKEILENFPHAQIISFNLADSNINYCIFLGKRCTKPIFSSISLKLPLFKEYSTIILRDLTKKNCKLYDVFDTKDYIDIIYKVYKKKCREEIIKKWRISRLRAKMIVKEEVKTQTRRKI